MPRGGQRNGQQGKAYSNRTDLGGQNVVQPQTTSPSKLAVQASTGQAYGAAGDQKASQSQVPMASAPAGVSQAQPQQNSAPTQPLNSPTSHGLPITHGMDIGDGAGSEVMAQPLDTQVTIKALGLLNSLGDDVSPQVAMIRQYLQASATNGGTQ